MIFKSLLILSVISSLIGIDALSNKFDAAALRSADQNYNMALANVKQQQLIFPEIYPTPIINPFVDRPQILSKNYLIGDYQSGQVILKYNENNRVPIASTTKIMTAVIAMENYQPSDVVTISQTAANQIGADVYLLPNEKITVSELLHCLLIKSGNDAAYALAEHLDQNGGTAKFVDHMNKKAQELGMRDTNYKDPAGLDVDGYSTARDLFILSRYALKNTNIINYTKIAKYTAYNIDKTISHPLDNSNRLVSEYNYQGAIGIKTGYMPEAGHCLVSAAERDGHTLIGVILNTYADTASASADESKKMLDWAFQNVLFK